MAASPCRSLFNLLSTPAKAGAQFSATDLTPCVYIVASRRNGTLYTGSAIDLPKRIWEHRNGVVSGFTRRYGCKLLVWYEAHSGIEEARRREKQIKEWRRAWKLQLVEELNSTWADLYERIAQG